MVLVSLWAIFFISLTGVCLQIYHFGWAMLLYYTLLSNLLVTLFTAYLLYQNAFKKIPYQKNLRLLRQKAAVTMAILITFLIYHFLLSPYVSHQDYWNWANLIVHYLTPLSFLMHTLIFDPRGSYRPGDPLIWTLIPFTYFLFALLNGLLVKWSVPGSPDSPFPYYFLNVETYGWSGMLLNSLVICLVYLLIAYLFLLIKTFLGPKSDKSLTACC